MLAWHWQQHQHPVFVIFDEVKPDPEQYLRHCPNRGVGLEFWNMKIRCLHPGLLYAWSLLCTVASNNHNRVFMTDNCSPVHHSITTICITRCWLLGSINIQPLLKITVVTQSSAARWTGSPRYWGLWDIIPMSDTLRHNLWQTSDTIFIAHWVSVGRRPVWGLAPVT